MAPRKYTKDGAGKGVITQTSAHAAVMQYDPDELAEGSEGLNAGNILIPRLAILEGLSPQIKPRALEFIPGAAIGQIADLVFKQVWDGEQGIHIVPCVFKDIYIEWAPRNSGEGIVNYYGPDSTEYDKLRPDKKMKRYTRDGNEIVKHGTIYCLNLSAGGRPSILPMSSTRYKSAQQFNTLRSEETIPGPNHGKIEKLIDFATGEQYDHKIEDMRLRKMCARVYQVTVGERSKGDNDWHVPIFTKGEETKVFDPSLALWRKANDFAKQVEAGMVMGDFGRDDEGETTREDAAM